jgi:hypothetical protein
MEKRFERGQTILIWFSERAFESKFGEKVRSETSSGEENFGDEKVCLQRKLIRRSRN